jgi:hypothetical protein
MITSTGGCGPVLDIGSGCDPAASACPRDATCDASAHVCVHYMRVGGPCSATGPACSTGASFGLAYCDGQSYSSGNCQILIPLLYCDSGTNTCALSLAVGDPCTPPPLGYEDPCLGRCDATTLKCVAQ